MEILVIVTQNNEFIEALSINTNIEVWARNWIEDNDNDTEFWNGGTLSICGNEIVFWGDNGCLFLNSKIVTI